MQGGKGHSHRPADVHNFDLTCGYELVQRAATDTKHPRCVTYIEQQRLDLCTRVHLHNSE
jgi:hypothetical protein